MPTLHADWVRSELSNWHVSVPVISIINGGHRVSRCHNTTLYKILPFCCWLKYFESFFLLFVRHYHCRKKEKSRVWIYLPESDNVLCDQGSSSSLCRLYRYLLQISSWVLYFVFTLLLDSSFSYRVGNVETMNMLSFMSRHRRLICDSCDDRCQKQ